MYSLGKEFINGPCICLLYVYTSSTIFLLTFNIEMRNVIVISYFFWEFNRHAVIVESRVSIVNCRTL